jgi:hypothetical protein
MKRREPWRVRGAKPRWERMAGGKSTRDDQPRKPRVAILSLAKELREQAGGSEHLADTLVADLVACAWLLDVRRGRGAGSRRIAHAARELLTTIDPALASERATPRPLPPPAEWWEQLQRFAGDRPRGGRRIPPGLEEAPTMFGLLEQAKSTEDRRAVRLHVANAMVRFAIATVPGIDATHSEAAGRLALRLALRRPKDTAQLCRWTLTACGVPGRRTNRADGNNRMKKHRTGEM